LIEHFAGKFPLWMAPVQAIILPINDDLIEYANTIKKESETSEQKEKETGTLSVRTFDGKIKYKISHQDFFEQIFLHIKKKNRNFDIL